MLKIKYFGSETDLVEWVNGTIRVGDIISIVKNNANGQWVLFYAH